MPCSSLVLNLLIAGGCLAQLLQTSTRRRHAFTIADEKLPEPYATRAVDIASVPARLSVIGMAPAGRG
ncbi:hypothetical protein EN829_044115, partial [Mesorhizobium sp. M00.F.Ca.ET.186.01.1.1]